MDALENARTTPHGRMLMVDRLAAGRTVSAVAAALGTSPRTVRKWRDRFAAEGEPGLRSIHEAHSQAARIDGVRVRGHMDYGKKDPSLGWR